MINKNNYTPYFRKSVCAKLAENPFLEVKKDSTRRVNTISRTQISCRKEKSEGGDLCLAGSLLSISRISKKPAAYAHSLFVCGIAAGERKNSQTQKSEYNKFFHGEKSLSMALYFQVFSDG